MGFDVLAGTPTPCESCPEIKSCERIQEIWPCSLGKDAQKVSISTCVVRIECSDTGQVPSYSTHEGKDHETQNKGMLRTQVEEP